MYQPVTMSTYALNYEIGNLDPSGYHLFNVLLFLIVIFLIWRLLYTLTSNYWAAFFITVFFAVHPFAVESVTWITGRIAMLMVLFMLIALNYYASGGRNFIILFLLYLLATLSKINGILLPVYLFIIDFSLQNKPFTKSNLLPKAGMLLLVIPILIFSLTLREPYNSISIWEYILSAPAKYLWYLNHIFPLYKYSPVYETPTYFDWRNLSGILFIAITFWIYRQSSDYRRKLIIMGGLIFALSLVPHMVTFSNGSYVGDRYGFVSFIGIVIILTAVIDQFSNRRKYYVFIVTSIVIISILNIIVTYRYSKKWEDSKTLWTHAVEVVPESSFAHTKLGTLLFLNGDSGARKELEMSISLDPDFGIPYYNLGSINFYEGKYAEAIKYYTKVYELSNNTGVLIDRARSYFELGEYDKAINDLNLYVVKWPEARAFFLRGQSKLALGLDACTDLKLALDMGMNEALAYYAKNCMGNN